MLLPRYVIAASLLAVIGLLASPAALALRCDGEIVGEGEPAYMLRKACGPPDHVTLLYDPADDYEGAKLWYYDLGFGSLLREITIRNGRLQRIRTINTEIPHSSRAADSCQPTQINTGMTSYELLARCGEPIQREGHYKRRGVWRNHHFYGYRVTWVQIWYYAYDDVYIDRRVKIIDGRVAAVDTVD